MPFESYLKKGLLKRQSINFKQIEKQIVRAKKDLETARLSGHTIPAEDFEAEIKTIRDCISKVETHQKATETARKSEIKSLPA